MEETEDNGVFITKFNCEICGNRVTWMTNTSQLDMTPRCSSCV